MPRPRTRRERLTPSTVCMVLLATAQLSAKATWIEIQNQPPHTGVVAGEAIPPAQQPIVALWNHRGSEDIFGRYVPPSIVYDSELAGVLVQATLLEASSGEERDMLGQRLLESTCGRAAYTNLQIQAVGQYRIMFSATFLTRTASTNTSRVFQVEHGAPHSLVLTQEPLGFWNKRPFQVQPVVEVRDKGDNLVSGNNSRFVGGSTLAIKVELITAAENSIWNKKAQLNAVGGVARFGELPCVSCFGVSKAGIAVSEFGYNLALQFSPVFGTDYEVAPVKTASFDVATWPPYDMAISNVPPSPVGGLAFDKQPSITLLDINGIVATWDSGETINVTVSLRSRASYIPADLRGTTSVMVVRGKGYFTDLRIDFMSVDYTLQFSLISKTITTVSDKFPAPFNVEHGAAYKLGLDQSSGFPATNGTQPGGARAGFSMLIQPVVLVLDVVDNMLWTTAVNVSADVLELSSVAGLTTAESISDYGFQTYSTRTVISCPLCKKKCVSAGVNLLGKHDCSKCKATARDPASCGTAPFTDLRVDSAFKDIVLQFSSVGLQSVQSRPFRVPVGDAFALFITQQPQGIKYDSQLVKQPVISVKDRGNNTLPSEFVLGGTTKSYVTAQLCQMRNGSLDCFSSCRPTNMFPSVTTRSFSAGAGSGPPCQFPFVDNNEQTQAECIDAPSRPFRCLSNTADLTGTIVSAEVDCDKRSDDGDCTYMGSVSGSIPRCIRYCSLANRVTYTYTTKDEADRMMSLVVAGGGSTEASGGIKSLLVCDTDNCNVELGNPCSYVTPAKFPANTTPQCVAGDTRFNGLKWERVGPNKTAAGNNTLNSSALSQALQRKTLFSEEEWNGMGVGDVFIRDFIKSGDFYYKPAVFYGTCNCNKSTGPGVIATKALIINGEARFTDMKIMLVGTKFVLRFCSSPVGLRCVDSEEFEVTEDPMKLLVKTQPAHGIPGLALPVSPVVQLGDVYSSKTSWEPASGFVVNATLCEMISRINQTSPEWKCAPDARWLEMNLFSACDYQTPDLLQDRIQGVTSVHVVDGVASFSDIRIDQAGTYKLKFTSGGLVAVESNPFVVATGAPVKLTILVHAAGAVPGLPFQTQPTVAVVDQGGNHVESEQNTSINATLWTHDQLNLGLVPVHFKAPSHSIGYHEATVLTRFGIGIFEGLRIDKAGIYTIRYDAANLLSINQSISVSLGLGMQLGIESRPTGCCARAACGFRASQEPTCRDVPVISILDLGDNKVPWDGVQINASVFARSGARSVVRIASFLATSDARGQAQFSDFGIDQPGHYTLRFKSMSPYEWRTRHPNGSWTSEFYWDFVPTAVNFSVSGRFFKMFLEVLPADIIPGSPMAQQPVIILRDAAGYAVDHDWSSLVTASVIGSNGNLVPLGGKKKQVATPAKNSNYSDHGGRVFFSDLQIDVALKCLRMRFSATSAAGEVIELDSFPFNVEVGNFHKIQVTQNPAQAEIGLPFGIQPHVELTDFGGNTVLDDSTTFVTASVFRGTVADVTSDIGKQIVRMEQGKARFVDLKTNIAAQCIQLEMLAVGRQPGYSDPFEIKPSSPHQLQFLDDEARTRAKVVFEPKGPRPGLPLLSQPSLKVEDVHGNRIGRSGGLAGGVTATLLEGGKPAKCFYPVKHCLKGTTYASYDNFDGIARFTDLRIDRVNTTGAYSILFASNNLEVEAAADRITENENLNSQKLVYTLVPVESARNLQVVAGELFVGLEVTVEPDKFVPGLPMKVAPILAVVDAGGNRVRSATPTTISCRIRGANQSLELFGTTIVLAFNGLEVFEGLGVNSTARQASFIFDSSVQLGSGGFVTSFPFDVSGPLRNLHLLSQTITARAGEVFSTDAVVRGFDKDDLIVTTFGHPPLPKDTADVVTVAIDKSIYHNMSYEIFEVSTNHFAYCIMQPINETTVVLGDIVINTTFNATTNISYNVTVDSRANFTFNTTRACYYDARLQGKNVSTYSYGLANFTDLRIDIVGTYRLRFGVSFGNISVLSEPIVITNAKADHLIILKQVQGPKEATYPLRTAPDVQVLDRFRNIVLDEVFTVSATFYQHGQQVPAKYVLGTLSVNTSRGIASFNESGMGLSLAGDDFSIQISIPGLPVVFTDTFAVPVGPPHRLKSVTSPTQFFQMEPFSDHISFELLDKGDNLVKSSDNYTVSLWNMRGCENCTNASVCTTKQEKVFEREYDSARLPCGQRVSGLSIVQPFCMAEYLSDMISSYCTDVLHGDEEEQGSLNTEIKEGDFPTQWRFECVCIERDFFGSCTATRCLEMSISAYEHNTTNNSSNETVNESHAMTKSNNGSTLLKLALKYTVILSSNGSQVSGRCTSDVNGLSPELYNVTDSATGWDPITKTQLRELLGISNLVLADMKPAGTPQTLMHQCDKFNFSSNLENGKGSFQGLTLVSPSNATEDLKLRITFKDREYAPSYVESIRVLGPGYRLYRQDLIPAKPKISIPAMTTQAHNSSGNLSDANLSSLTLASHSPLHTPVLAYTLGNDSNTSNQQAVDFSKYHIIIETQSFQVSGPPVALQYVARPSTTSTGGTALQKQPMFKIVDGNGRLVTKALDITITATLLGNNGGKDCNVARPHRCPAPMNLCSRGEEFCPILTGQKIMNTILGVASFTDLAITICNDATVAYDICVFGELNLEFNATSWQQSLEIGGGFMTPVTNASLQNLVSEKITNFIGPPAHLTVGIEPQGGSRAGELLVVQPQVVTQDAGGNRIVRTPVNLTAVLSVYNKSIPLDDYSKDGLEGTRTVVATNDGSFKWTNLAISISSNQFMLSFVQYAEVPGFPRAATATSSLFVIEAGAGVRLKMNMQPGRAFGGEPFTDQPRLFVVDVRDNLVRFEIYNVSVCFTDDAQRYGGELTKTTLVEGYPSPDLSPRRLEVTTVNGIAQFVGLTIDRARTCYQLNFSAPGLESARSDRFDVLPGKVRQLLIKRQPALPIPGQVLKTQPVVHLTDWGQNPVRYLRDRVEVKLVPGNATTDNAQEMKLYGTNVLRTVDGVVEFTDLMVYHVGKNFRFEFSRYVGGMASVSSAAFAVELGLAYRLHINTMPAGSMSGKFLLVQPVVQVEDAGGNRLNTSRSFLVTAKLFEKGLPSAAALRGPQCSAYECAAQTASNKTDDIRVFCPTCVTAITELGYDPVTTQASVEGISRFTALSISKVGTGYSIRFFSRLLLSAESYPPLSVQAGMPVHLKFQTLPSGFMLDTAFRVQPVVQLTDAGGNHVSSEIGEVKVTLEQTRVVCSEHLLAHSDTNMTPANVNQTASPFPNQTGARRVGRTCKIMTQLNTGDARLLPAGNTQVGLSIGRAIFLKLRVNQTGLNFSLLFTGSMCTNTTSGAQNVSCTTLRSKPFNVTGPRTRVENKVQVETSSVGMLLQPQPQVHLLDADNRTVTWDSGRLLVTVEIDPATNVNSANLSGTLVVPCCAGVCSYTDLVIDKAMVGYRLRFSAPPLARLASPFFDVVGPRHLRVVQEPVGYVTGDLLIKQPHVQVLDIYRRAVSGYWLTISAGIRAGTGPAGGALKGTVKLYTNESTVVFTDLLVEGPGSGYVLEFTCLWFEPAVTTPFDVDLVGRPNVCAAGSCPS